ncbi:MAG: hypothetical protein NZ809_03210 [Thermodesulfovibrio sp.]|nr:hypothetical protein [Thermodesulfovibrio sp.]
MKKNIADIAKNLNDDRQTGMLTIAFSNEKNLLKIYFKEGQIYHISLGNKKGMECLKELSAKEPLSCNFIPQITVDLKSEISSTEDVIKILKDMNKSAAYGNFQQSFDLSKIKEEIKVALIRQIGPIGGKIIEKYIQEKWTPSTPPTKEDFLKLFDMLKDEIEDPASRKDFLAEVNKIIGGV